MSLDDNFKDSLENEKKIEELRRSFVKPAPYVSLYSSIGSLTGVLAGLGIDRINGANNYIDLTKAFPDGSIIPAGLVIGSLIGCLVGYGRYRMKKGKEEKQ